MGRKKGQLTLGEKILMALVNFPNGATKEMLNESIKDKEDSVRRELERQEEHGNAVKLDEEKKIYAISQQGNSIAQSLIQQPAPVTKTVAGGGQAVAPAIAQPAAAAMGKAVPYGDLELFKDICRGVGIVPENFLDWVADYIFRGDPDDIEWVWRNLNEFARIDQARRITKIWAMRKEISMPPEIQDMIERVEGEAGAGGGRATARRRMKYMAAGDSIIPDPEGEFDTPQQALNFIQARKSAEKAGGGEGGQVQVEMAKGLVDIARSKPEEKPIDVVQLAQAMKTDPMQIIEVAQALNPAPAGEKRDMIDTIKAIAEVVPTVVPILKSVMGLDRIELALTNLATRDRPTLDSGVLAGLGLDELMTFEGFLRDQRRQDREEKRKDDASQARVGLIKQLQDQLPQALSAAERAVGRMESQPRKPAGPRQRQPEPAAASPPAPGQFTKTEILEGSCPSCGNPIGIWKGTPNPICPHCQSEIHLGPPQPEAPRVEVSEEEAEE